MKFFAVVLFFCFILSINKSFAVEGCMLNGVLYTKRIVLTGEYYSAATLSPNYCSWTPSASTSNCTVCTNLNVLSLLCLGTAPGIYSDYTMVECNLDQYTVGLGFAVAIFGFVIIRKRKL